MLKLNVLSGFGGGSAVRDSGSGYNSGGESSNVIDKFPFSTDTTATDVGDLTVARYSVAGQSSSTHGYTSGGNVGPYDVIDKFTFTSDANATDVGDLLSSIQSVTGQSSANHGYTTHGGGDSIEKFTFASDNDSTSVGSLSTGARAGGAGQSYVI